MTNKEIQFVIASELPERGQPLAGGTFVARYWLSGVERALVLLDDELSGAWGKYGEDVAGAKSFSDGAANTRAMAEAGSILAVKALELDAHIPSYLEGSLLMSAKADGVINLRDDRWHWLSTQSSAYNAFNMDFECGWVDILGKGSERLARPVRSLPIQ